jgi:hypothetical protein
MLTYADVCSRMLTYAQTAKKGTASHVATLALKTRDSGRGSTTGMLTYADVC